MNQIVLSVILVTAVFSADVVKNNSNSKKKMTIETAKTDQKVLLKKEIRFKPKTYPRGNIATH